MAGRPMGMPAKSKGTVESSPEERPRRPILQLSSGMICGRSTVVRMPEGASQM